MLHPTSTSARAHLVGVHVRLGAAARLPDAEGEVVVQLAVDHLIRRLQASKSRKHRGAFKSGQWSLSACIFRQVYVATPVEACCCGSQTVNNRTYLNNELGNVCRQQPELSVRLCSGLLDDPW